MEPGSPRRLDELAIEPETGPALGRLADAGFVLLGVTNQPEVARGLVAREIVEAINAALRNELGLRDILVCWHDQPDECECRKPKPGLILRAAERHDVDLDDSFMVGDRWKDVVAGTAAGCRTVLIDQGWAQPERCRPDFVASTLAAAVDWILAQPSHSV